MAIFDNLNKTSSGGVAAGVVDYYERTLLENIRPEMVHGRDAQHRPLPEHNGRYVNFRRMIPFEAATEPLTEGVTPTGQELKQAAFTVMVKPYGRHVEVTDELNFFQLDNLHRETAQLLSDQAVLTLDTLCRDAMNAGLNVQYPAGVTDRSGISASHKLTAAAVKEAVRTLKRANAKPFPDGFYHAIIHPDAVFDLSGDSNWVDLAKYQDRGRIERYELGCLYKVKFFESPNAKVFTAESVLYGSTSSLTLAAFDAASRTMTVSETLDEAAARSLTGKAVLVRYSTTSGGTTTHHDTPMCVERVLPGQKKIVFRWTPESAVTDNWTSAKSACIVPGGGGSDGARVYSTLVYGQNAFGCVELGGKGRNVRIIVNPPGSAGAQDPLAQRGTIAWKVRGFGCGVLQDAFMVRIEHGATV